MNWQTTSRARRPAARKCETCGKPFDKKGKIPVRCLEIETNWFRGDDEVHFYCQSCGDKKKSQVDLPTLYLDFETFSEEDIKCGAHKYAAHPTTKIMMLGFAIDNRCALLWAPPWIRARDFAPRDMLASDRDLRYAIKQCDRFAAHNALFDRKIWSNLLTQYGFPDIPLKQWACTMAKTSMYGMPRGLSEAGMALNLPIEKDMSGNRLMKKWCKPRKPSKHNKSTWYDDPDEFRRICEYCIKDIEVMQKIDMSLKDLPRYEKAVYVMDQKINDRGLYIDERLCRNLDFKVRAVEERWDHTVHEATGGALNSARQTQKLTEYLHSLGVGVPDLKAETVTAFLQTLMPDLGALLLKARQATSKQSVKKLRAMLRRMEADCYARGTILYHGAATGRFSGRAIQPHNYVRDSFEGDSDALIAQLGLIGLREVEEIHGSIFAAISKALRGMIIAPPGLDMFCADFSQIEARVIAWMAEDEPGMLAFLTGRDVYKVAAMGIYHCGYEDVTKEQRQIGKVAVLSLGYQGWVGAFQRMAVNYGVEVPDDEAEEIIKNWRDGHPAIVDFWYRADDAAKNAIKHPGKAFRAGPLVFGMKDNFLKCLLPSQRMINYYQPIIVEKMHYRRPKESITYMGVDSQTRRYTRLSTYGGSLVQSAVQGLARDLLVHCMLKLEKDGRFKTFMHVHDEAVAYGRPEENLDDFLEIMQSLPKWAEGLPLKADGWRGKRYHK